MATEQPSEAKVDGRTLRAERTKTEVHRKLVEAVRDSLRHGILDPSPGAIAKAAGVSATTLYNHFPDGISGVLTGIRDEIDTNAVAAAEPFIGRGEILDGIKAIMSTYALELVKHGPGGKLLLAHHYERLAVGEIQRPMLEGQVAELVATIDNITSATAQEFAKALGFLVRGSHTTWSNFQTTDDKYKVSDTDFVAKQAQLVDEAMLIAKHRTGATT